MKNRLLLFLLCITAIAFSQDTPYHNDIFNIDGCSMYNNQIYSAQQSTNSSSIWQVSPPLKSTIDTVRTDELILITDSINPYPINDTSSFYIKQDDSYNLAGENGTTISGYYWCNTDSLKDYGTIEFFLPLYGHWINLNDDTVYSDFYPDSIAAAD